METSIAEPDEMNIANQTIQFALDYLWTHKGENVTLAQMAAMCHLSCSYFSRLFSTKMGCSYSAYVNKAKIEWAKQLLCNSQDTVSSIANMLGFVDAGYFIKVFRKYIGTTPAAFRSK